MQDQPFSSDLPADPASTGLSEVIGSWKIIEISLRGLGASRRR